MGNTNLPQSGAAGTENSRDTLAGADQLAHPPYPIDKDHRPGAHGDENGGVGPSPSRPKDAPARIPGQLRDPHDGGHDAGTSGDESDVQQNGAMRATQDSYTPRNTGDREDPRRSGGHAQTGHSPPDAT